MSAPRRLPARRPAESTGALGAMVTVIAAAAGASTTLVAVLGAISAAAPAGVTWLVGHGGIRGVARALWGGQR